MSVQARADAGLKTSPSAAFLRQQQQPPPLFSGATAAEVDSVAGGGFALQQELPLLCTPPQDEAGKVMKNAEIDAHLVNYDRLSHSTPSVSSDTGTTRGPWTLD